MFCVKSVVVGDSAVGKTCLLSTRATGNFPGDYVPTIFNCFSANKIIDSVPISFGFWDTPGDAFFTRFRPLCYPRTDLFIICFSLIDPVSFESVKLKWKPEIVAHSQEAPIVLIGTKLDLRDDAETIEKLGEQQLQPISHEQGLEMSKEIGAQKYIECSASSNIDVELAFDDIISCIFKSQEICHECGILLR